MKITLLSVVVCLFLIGAAGVASAQSGCPIAEAWQRQVVKKLDKCPGEIIGGNSCIITNVSPTGITQRVWNEVSDCFGEIRQYAEHCPRGVSCSSILIIRTYDLCEGTAASIEQFTRNFVHFQQLCD